MTPRSMYHKNTCDLYQVLYPHYCHTLENVWPYHLKTVLYYYYYYTRQ